MGFFSDIGKAFNRLIKITPQSFTPKNIGVGLGNTIVAGVPGAAFNDFVKTGVKNAATAGTAGIVDFNRGFRVNVPFSAAQVNQGAISTLDTFTFNKTPPEVNTFFNSPTGRIIATGIGAVGAFFTGNFIASGVGAAAPSSNSGVFATLGKGAVIGTQKGVTAFTATTSGAGFFQVIQSIFGTKIAAIVSSVLAGNFAQAIQIATTKTPDAPSVPKLFGPSGGGGGGFLPSSGQSQLSTGIIPVLGIGVVLLAVWYFLRKRG